MAQFKRVWLPYKHAMTDYTSSDLMNIKYHPREDESTEKANTEIQNLITQGWKIVSTAPVTGSSSILNPKGDDFYFTYTTGIEVFMVKE